MFEISRIENFPINSNSFVVYNKTIGLECVIIDPGSSNNTNLYNFIASKNLIPKYIILTHEHFDHCWGGNDLRERFPTIKLVCSSGCSNKIQDMKQNLSVFHHQPGFKLLRADIEVNEYMSELSWGKHKISFYPAMGHTASGIMFTIGNYLFTGDELIKDIKTVTKLKTGSKDKLKESIQLLNTMKGKGLLVCPGHGDTFSLDDYDLEKAIK